MHATQGLRRRMSNLSSGETMTLIDSLARARTKTLKILVIISISLVIAVYPIMAYSFLLSGDESSVIQSQLSFSGDFLKDQYLIIIDNGGLPFYRLGQWLDFAFMVGYGILSFGIALLMSKKFAGRLTWARSGELMAFLGLLAASCDAVENIFIHLTLVNPLGFNDWLAIAHSSFALVKWILLALILSWAVISAFKLLISHLRNRDNNP